jgi:hypothetical protein
MAYTYDRTASGQMPPGQVLREDPWAYFTHEPGTILVPIHDIETIRARPTGIENAEKYMYLAAYEGGKKRKPISVKKGDDGKWVVLDGNSTSAIARKHGWKHIPALETKEDGH